MLGNVNGKIFFTFLLLQISNKITQKSKLYHSHVIPSFLTSIYDIPPMVEKNHPQTMTLAIITSDFKVRRHPCVQQK
jgi:hypothetical protein